MRKLLGYPGDLRQFLGEGRHGTMDWLQETAERRAHPNGLWDEARCAVVLGMNYGPDRDPLQALEDGLTQQRAALVTVAHALRAEQEDFATLTESRTAASPRT